MSIPASGNGHGLEKPIAIYYEHPDWFRPLFHWLDERGVPWVKIDARFHQYNVAANDREYSLLFNRMSPSAWQRGAGHCIFYTLSSTAPALLPTKLRKPSSFRFSRVSACPIRKRA